METGVPEYDFQKNRPRDKYCGKTARVKNSRCGPYSEPEHIVERDSFFNFNNKDDDRCVALTEVDDLFPSLYDGGTVTLGRNNLWETVIEKLKATTIDPPKRQYGVSKNRGYTISYNIPVSKYALMPTIPKNISQFGGASRYNTNNNKWLCWKGKYYDPAFIYDVYMNAYGNARLRKVCPTTQKPHNFLDGSKIQALNCSISIMGKPTPQLKDTISCSNTCNYYSNLGNYYKISPGDNKLFKEHTAKSNFSTTLYNNREVKRTVETSLDNGIVIDFHKATCLTHIGVRSQDANVINFPKGYHQIDSLEGEKLILEKPRDKHDKDTVAINDLKNTVNRARNRRRRGRRRRGGASNRNGFVYVLQQLGKNGLSSIPYVTAFELHYKKIGIGGWCQAATNIQIEVSNYGLSEFSIDLKAIDAFNCKDGLVAKEIKLIPIDWHIKPTYMVRCYGIEKISKEHDIISNGDSVVDTVTYTVTEGMTDNWKHDGNIYGRYYDRYYDRYYEEHRDKVRSQRETMKDRDIL